MSGGKSSILATTRNHVNWCVCMWISWTIWLMGKKYCYRESAEWRKLSSLANECLVKWYRSLATRNGSIDCSRPIVCCPLHITDECGLCLCLHPCPIPGLQYAVWPSKMKCLLILFGFILLYVNLSADDTKYAIRVISFHSILMYFILIPYYNNNCCSHNIMTAFNLIIKKV